MHISIICAAFSSKYLDSWWDSIKRQTYKKFEVIMVIDGSQEVLDWYKEKKEDEEFKEYDVWYIIIGKNRGHYGLIARNVGAMCASYDHIIFLDDDNYFEEDDYLETLVKIEKETGKIPYTKLHIVGKKPGSTVDRYKDTHPSRHHIDLGNPFYRKEFFLKYGYFDDSKNRIMFDYDLIELIKNGEGEDKFTKADCHLYFRHKRY